MKNSDLFPLLNLASLKTIARDWAQRYPAIESLTLYCGRGRSTLAAYVVVAKATMTEDPQDPTEFNFKSSSGFKFRIKNLKIRDPRLEREVINRYIKKAQLTEAEAEQFHEEVKQFCKTVRERIEKGAFRKDWSEAWGGHLLEDLTSPGVYVYKDITSFINADDWLFRIIEKEEDLLYLEDDIIPDSAFPLYERKKKKPRLSNIHKDQVRKVAMDLWGKATHRMTKSAIYYDKKMQDLLKSLPKKYAQSVVEGWIKDQYRSARLLLLEDYG